MTEKVFSREAVVIAVRLATQGMAGLLSPEKALETIETLPEDLADIVMEETCKACREQAKAKARVMAKMLNKIAAME